MQWARQTEQILALCYRAATDPGLWQRCLAEIAEAFGACRAEILRCGGHGTGTSILWSGSPRSAGHLPAGCPCGNRGAARFRPIPEVVAFGGAESRHMLPGPAFDFLSPAPHGLEATVWAEDGAVLRLVLRRCWDQDAFGSVEEERLARIVPHLGNAIRLHHELAKHRSRTRALARLLDQFPYEVFIIGQDLRVFHCNRAARTITAQGGPVTLVHERLTLTDPSAQRTLERLVKAALSSAPDGGRQVGRMTLKRCTVGPDIPIVVLSLAEGGWYGMHGGRPAVAVIMKGMEPKPDQLPRLLAETFGLTPKECELAGLIVTGHSLIDAAEKLGITKNTARTHMKRIYAKTGAERQSDIVRLIYDFSFDLFGPTEAGPVPYRLTSS